MLVWPVGHLVLCMWLTSLRQTGLAWVAPVSDPAPAFKTDTARHSLCCTPRVSPQALQKVEPSPLKQLSPCSEVRILVPDLKTPLVILESIHGFWIEVPHGEEVGHSLDSCIEGFFFFCCFVLDSLKCQILHICMLVLCAHFQRKCFETVWEAEETRGPSLSLPVCKTLLW